MTRTHRCAGERAFMMLTTTLGPADRVCACAKERHIVPSQDAGARNTTEEAGIDVVLRLGRISVCPTRVRAHLSHPVPIFSFPIAGETHR